MTNALNAAGTLTAYAVMNLQDRQLQNAIVDQTNFSVCTQKTGIIITYAITANARSAWGRRD